jgi:hypothetical protein
MLRNRAKRLRDSVRSGKLRTGMRREARADLQLAVHDVGGRDLCLDLSG